MNAIINIIQSKRKLIITDVVVFLIIYLTPTLSHLLPIPIYFFDPMRVVVFTSYILVRNKRNSLIIAITIPLFSSLFVGHPSLFKAILISLELTINIVLFVQFNEKFKLTVPGALFLSIVLSKLIYYFFKYILITVSLIDGRIITTNLFIQTITIIGITLIFSIAFWKYKK